MSVSILIVEDEAIVARDLRVSLIKLGYTPLGVADRGDKAIELIEELRPDVVLINVQLQGQMGGEGTGELIRSRFDLPVVFVTSKADNAKMQRSIATEPLNYVMKPFEERELRSVIELALSKVRCSRELRDSKASKAVIMAAAMDAIITTDIEGRIEEFNPAAVRIFGLKREEAVGQLLVERLLPSTQRERYHLEVSRCLTLKNGFVQGRRLDLTAQRADGNEFPAELSLSRTEHENRPVVISFWRDLSQSKLLEQQVLQGQKMQMVGQLAGGMAHDFNNLLTIINGHCEALFSILRADFRAINRVQEIAKAGDRGAKLTRQLLAFGRQQILRPRVLNLNDLITDVQRMLGRLIREDITLRPRLSHDLGMVQVDPGQIEQVLMNLVVNARDAMPQGGQLTIETANAELDEHCTAIQPWLKPGRYALLTVSDTGCGMDRATQARLFEPFFTTKQPGKGVGLGLATCYGIIKQSGGNITVYSEPGRGSSFMIYLPLTEDASAKSQPQTPPEPVGGNEVVLVAEDEDCVRVLLRNLLEGKGYTVLEGSNGEEALEVAKQHGKPISLLLTDLVMPKMGGRELAERFSPLHPQARVLFMSGYTDDMALRQSLLSGEVEFIQKPYTMNVLLNTVRTLLDRERTESPPDSMRKGNI